MREYGKVFSRIWQSESFRRLSQDGQKLALYLLTCPHGTLAGLFRVPDGYAAEDLQWSSERVSEGFLELLENGFATRCERTKWVWVNNYLEWNPLENPNQQKAAVKIVAQVPVECSWKRAFMRANAQKLGLEPPEEMNGSETVPEGFLNQEQEQEQEKEKEPNGSVAEGDRRILPGCPHDEIVRIYHDTLPMLPRVRLMTEARKKAMRAFWRWVLTSKKSDGTPRASTRDQALTWIHDYFERATCNDFLMGRGYRSDRHANWQCDIDFLMTEKGKRHVIEKTQEVEA